MAPLSPLGVGVYHRNKSGLIFGQAAVFGREASVIVFWSFVCQAPKFGVFPAKVAVLWDMARLGLRVGQGDAERAEVDAVLAADELVTVDNLDYWVHENLLSGAEYSILNIICQERMDYAKIKLEKVVKQLFK